MKCINCNCISYKQWRLRWIDRMQIDEWNDCDAVSARSTESHQSIDGSSQGMDKCEIVRKIKFNQLSICCASIWFCWWIQKLSSQMIMVVAMVCVLITWKCDYCAFFISISACSPGQHKKINHFFGHSSKCNCNN